MQAPPPTGCAGTAPPPLLPVGTTLDEELIVLLGGSSAPATPNPAAKTRAAPPHTATAALPARFVTTTNCRFSSRDAHSDAECFSRARRESGSAGGDGG